MSLSAGTAERPRGMTNDDDSQTSLIQPEGPDGPPAPGSTGYVPVATEGTSSTSPIRQPPAPTQTCSWKVCLLVMTVMVIAGALGFLAGADFGPTVAPQLRGSQDTQPDGPHHKVIAVAPAGVRAEAKVHHQHEHVVTDAEEERSGSQHHARHAGNHSGQQQQQQQQHHHRNGSHGVNGSNSSLVVNGSSSSHSNGSRHEHHKVVKPKGPTCDAQHWPDKANGLVCGDCKVLVDKFSYFYETCDNYCHMQGRQCTAAFEEEADSCEVKHEVKCNESLFTSDAICECGLHVNHTLKSEFEKLAKTKVESSCGAPEEDVDFWTDGSLFSIANVDSAEDCHNLCKNQHGCGAWTWGRKMAIPGLAHMCFLKRVDWGHSITKHKKKGLVSGHPWAPPCDGFKQDFYYNNRSKRNGSADDDGWNQEDSDHLHGVIRNKHGYCLDSAVPHEDGSEVQMRSCEQSRKSQEWKWERQTGQIKNRLGLCLETRNFAELSNLHTTECDITSWNQQWEYKSDTLQIKNWRGPCVDAGERDIDGGMVYLRLCAEENWNQQFEFGALEDMHIEEVKPVDKPLTLYCFALMLPGSYEQDLLAMQYDAKVSLFACEAYAVYSNQAIEVADGLTSGTVDSDLKCKKGGEFGTALNLPIFLAVWKKVVSDAVFMEHDWTAKVDPDAVFIPSRLRSIVALHPETDNGVYLNNCKFGLHGPVEVFSRNAVISWSKGSKHCINHFWKLCKGDCQWGEDLFIDQCLQKVLHVRRENDYRILTEDHCDPPKNWDSCMDDSRVAYHPFKNATGYRKCLQNAEPHLKLPPLPPPVKKEQNSTARHNETAHHEKARHNETAHHEAARQQEHHAEEAHEAEKAEDAEEQRGGKR